MKPVFLIIASVVVVVLGWYELVAILTPVPGDMISEIIWDLSREYPIIPFIGGALAAHFWWQRR